MVIVKTSGDNIVRYNLGTKDLGVIKASTSGDFPQDVSVDSDNGVVYWVNFNVNFKVMSTSYAGETIDLNITDTGTIKIAQDELYLYVLVVSNEIVYKYKKSTWEQMGSIVIPSGTSGIEVAFGEYQSLSPASIKGNYT